MTDFVVSGVLSLVISILISVGEINPTIITIEWMTNQP
jgi:hypothetical protein